MKKTDAAQSNESALGPPRLIYTAGEAFADGSQIDLLAPLPGSGLRLALWDGTKETNASSIQYQGQTYVPVRLQPGLMRDITLPSECQ
jgi:hypothetical protein